MDEKLKNNLREVIEKHEGKKVFEDANGLPCIVIGYITDNENKTSITVDGTVSAGSMKEIAKIIVEDVGAIDCKDGNHMYQ